MRAAVHAFDDRIGRPSQLVVQPPFGKPAQDRVLDLVAVKSEGRGVWLSTPDSLVHGLHDVTANAELTKLCLDPRIQNPLGWADPF